MLVYYCHVEYDRFLAPRSQSPIHKVILVDPYTNYMLANNHT
jgi:hypothetical protein